MSTTNEITMLITEKLKLNFYQKVSCVSDSLNHIKITPDSHLSVECLDGENDCYISYYVGSTHVWGVRGSEKESLALSSVNYINLQINALIFKDIDSNYIGGIPVIEWGWGYVAGTEQFYAHGHLADDCLLSAVKAYTNNKLIGWKQEQITVYQIWNADEALAEFGCLSTYTLSKPSDNVKNNPLLRVTSFPATIITHELSHLNNTKYWCERFKDWFKGVDDGITPSELSYDNFPGLCVLGKKSSHESQSLLEWPTFDFELSLLHLDKWKNNGATDIQLTLNGLGVPYEKVTSEFKSKIKEHIFNFGDVEYSFGDIIMR